VQHSIKASIQAAASDTANPAVIRVALRILAIGLAWLHSWAAVSSQSMNADGISYLDIGDAYFNANWAVAVNPVWSPLYSWILGFGNFVINPPMEWAFFLVHAVNFLLFLCALASFEYFWDTLHRLNAAEQQAGEYSIPGWLWWVLGYLLFIWTSLSLIQIWAVTPDILMAVFVLLAAAQIVRIRSGETSLRVFALLGLLLGLGYLSKSFMFSVAFVFIGLSLLVQKIGWPSLRRTAITAAAFLIISLPFILAISNVKGRLTIGEAGTVTFLRYVNGMPFPHWQGDPARGMVPSHGSRVIHQSPPIYEFGEPIGGTYPISLDPSYWYEGIEPRFDPGVLLSSLFANSLIYLKLFTHEMGFLTAAVLALYFMGRRQNGNILQILRRWALVIPAVIALGLYALILVEDRYIAIFVLLFWPDFLRNIRVSDDARSRGWLRALTLIAALGLLINIGLFNLDGFARLNQAGAAAVSEPKAPPARPLQVAQALRDVGIEPGDRVGVIGYAYDSFWARLAGVKITTEMLDTDAAPLWRGSVPLQPVLQAFQQAGAAAVIAERVPKNADMTGWHQVENSSYYIYNFKGK
jgi:hypothetical protein